MLSRLKTVLGQGLNSGKGICKGGGSLSQIHILDGQTDEILDYIQADNIIDDTHKKSLEDTLETFEFIAFADKSYAQHLEKRNRIIIPDEDGTYREFVIFEVAKYRDTEGLKVQVFSHGSYLELKKTNVIYPNEFKGTISQHAGRALNKTGWQVGVVEGEGNKTISINAHTSPYENLRRIAKDFEVELRFRVETDGRKITGRYVDFLERIGEWRGREVEFGKDLVGIRRVEKQDIVTALLGLGPEREDGSRIEVLVEDFDALQRWGWYDEHGNLNHYIEVYEIESERSEMTEAEARQYTRTALNKRINTQVTYECEIADLEQIAGLEHEKIRFGDTIKIKDTEFNPPLYVEARVFEQERSIVTNEKNSIKLGDYIEYTEEEVHSIWEQLKKQIQNRVSYYEMVEYTYDKLTIDTKDETVFEEGKSFAEATGIQAREDAKAFAVEEDKKIKLDVERYADNVAEQKANSALEQAKMYSVAKTVYENQMNQIAQDLADKADLEYVDGQLVSKANKSDVYTIEDVDNMINNTVSKTQYETDKDGIVTQLESHGTRIGQNEQAIGLKADRTELNQVENSLSTKIANVEVKADQVTTRVESVEAEIDGLEVGGRNYALNSDELVEYKSNARFPYDVSDEIKNHPQTQFSVSFDMEYTGTEDISRVEIYFYNGKFLSYRDGRSSGNRENTPIGGLKNDGNWARYEGTIYTVDDIGNENNITIVVRVRKAGGGFSSEVRVKNIKVEKGNKATDWTPAPEDTEQDISNLRGRVNTAEGEIRTLAGEVSLKASKSEVDSLERRVSTAESELQVLPGEINAKVSKDGVIGAINATPETLLIDFDKVKMTGEIEAKHIKSLAGLNINDQFVVDSTGKVTIGNDRVTIDDRSISITRPDGAVWMQDGLVHQDYTVSGFDPHMTDLLSFVNNPGYKSSAIKSFSDQFYETANAEFIDGRSPDHNDIRSSSHDYTFRFQRYEFIHAARYIVFGYRVANNSVVGEHRICIYDGNTKLARIDCDRYSGYTPVIIDLGKPTYERKNLDLRLGWARAGMDREQYIRFRINRVYLTDYV